MIKNKPALNRYHSKDEMLIVLLLATFGIPDFIKQPPTSFGLSASHLSSPNPLAGHNCDYGAQHNRCLLMIMEASRRNGFLGDHIGIPNWQTN